MVCSAAAAARNNRMRCAPLSCCALVGAPRRATALRGTQIGRKHSQLRGRLRWGHAWGSIVAHVRKVYALHPWRRVGVGSEEPRPNGGPRWVGPGASAPPCRSVRCSVQLVFFLAVQQVHTRTNRARSAMHTMLCTAVHAPECLACMCWHMRQRRYAWIHMQICGNTPNAASFISSARGAACRGARARSLECNDMHSHVLHASCAEGAGPVQNHDAGVTGNLGIVHDPMPADMTCLTPHAACGCALAHGAWGVRSWGWQRAGNVEGDAPLPLKSMPVRILPPLCAHRPPVLNPCPQGVASIRSWHAVT